MAKAKAEELIKQGDKKTKKLFGGSSKYEDACELYEQAANQYKKAQDWEGAFAAFEKCIAMDVKLKQQSDQQNHLLEAAKCAKKFDMKQATKCQEGAIGLMESQGQYNKAARVTEDIAKNFAEELGEKESGPTKEDYELLIQWWQKAADLFKLEKHGNSNYNACRVHIADTLCQQGRYQEALEINEDMGNGYADDALLKFNARGFFFTSLLCHLALIEVATKEEGIAKFREKFEEYTDKDTQFTPATNEHRFCTAVIAAYEADDPKAYAEAHKAYERINPLDRQKTTMVLKGKATLKASPEDDLT